MTESFSAGFMDPSLGAQKVFRLALTAMSRPAEPRRADFRILFKSDPPAPPALAALLLALADRETPVWLSKDLEGAAEWLVFHAGSPITDDPGEAVFIAALSLSSLPPLSALPKGLERYPDLSATIIAASLPNRSGLLGSSNPAVWASGPGLKEPRPASDLGLTELFIDEWEDNHASYPLGVDAIFAGTDSIAGLPRSTRLTRRSP